MENQVEKIKTIIKDSIQVKQRILDDNKFVEICKNISDGVTDTFQKDKKVLFCGNGGSVADAQYLAAEFSGRYYFLIETHSLLKHFI